MSRLAHAAIAENETRADAPAGLALGLLRDELVRSGELRQGLLQITTAMAGALGVDGASVWVFDAERTRLTRVASSGPQGAEHAGGSELLVAAHPGYVGALREGAIVAGDVAGDARLAEVRRGLVEEKIGSLVDVPIWSNGQLAGVVRASSARPRAWSAADVELLSDAAAIATIPLQSAALRRAEEERERAETRLRRNHAAIMTLARSDSLSRGALDEALREITETASEILDVERSSVWVWNADQTAILCMELFQRTRRLHESGIELKSAQFPGYFVALKEERAISAHDAHTDPRTRELSEVYLAPLAISSLLDAPIRIGGRMIGVLCNEQVGPARRWTIEEEQFAGSLADFIALAMESDQRRETETQLRTMLLEYENLDG